MNLTEQQINYFQTFGFLRFDQLFIDEVDSITQHFEYIWEQTGGGHGGQ